MINFTSFTYGNAGVSQCLRFGWDYMQNSLGPSVQIYPCLWFGKCSDTHTACLFLVDIIFVGYIEHRFSVIPVSGTDDLSWIYTNNICIYIYIYCFQVLILISSDEQVREPEWPEHSRWCFWFPSQCLIIWLTWLFSWRSPFRTGKNCQWMWRRDSCPANIVARLFK